MLGLPDLSISRTPRGQPVIERLAGAGMSVSYAGEFCLLAVNAAGDIGVDIEFLRHDLDVLEIARTCFAAEEWRRLEAAPGSRRVEKFFALWTAKEAVLKCVGRGITGGMAWPCLPNLAVGGRALVDGIAVEVAGREVAGRQLVTALAHRACLKPGCDA